MVTLLFGQPPLNPEEEEEEANDCNAAYVGEAIFNGSDLIFYPIQ